MPIEIKVISHKGRPPVERVNVVFGREGGTIGRSAGTNENHLTLPDPKRYISRRHATIECENGLYYLTDTSVDGTCVNNRDRRIHEETVPLADGDHLWIGEYELSVHVSATERVATSAFGVDANAEEPMISPVNQASSEKNGRWWPDRDGDLIEESEREVGTCDQAEDAPLHDAFTPPDLAEEASQSGEIPKDFNFRDLIREIDETGGRRDPTDVLVGSDKSNLTDREIRRKESEDLYLGATGDELDDQQAVEKTVMGAADEPSKAPAADHSTAIQQIRQQAYGELLRIFLEAAGLRDANFHPKENIPELMETVGAVFREMVNGLMVVLRGRSEFKTQLKVAATVIKPADNNPLKFFHDIDEVLKQLLTGSQPGFVDGLSAVREGYTDIMNHQLALTAGLQAAVVGLIQRFDPHCFAKQYEEGVVFQKKAKSWDAYRQAYAEIANTALDDFFGEPFTRAYEAQLRQLQTKSKKGNEAKEE
jgi:type VI secretion system protein